jgi:hypothetical protein
LYIAVDVALVFPIDIPGGGKALVEGVDVHLASNAGERGQDKRP